MSTKHTPGPWSLDDVERCGYQVNADGRGVAFAIQRDDHPTLGQGISHETASANALLIHAVPDLLNALAVLADAAEARGIPCDAARAAIAKATGETA